jgi:hypothetical protein
MALKLRREAHCIVRACGRLQDQVSQLSLKARTEVKERTNWMDGKSYFDASIAQHSDDFCKRVLCLGHSHAIADHLEHCEL